MISGGLLHLEQREGGRVTANTWVQPAWTVVDTTLPARVVARVEIDGLALTMPVELARQLRGAITAALDAEPKKVDR